MVVGLRGSCQLSAVSHQPEEVACQRLDSRLMPNAYAFDNDHAHVADVGVRGAGDDQATSGREERVGVVAAQVVRGIERCVVGRRRPRRRRPRRRRRRSGRLRRRCRRTAGRSPGRVCQVQRQARPAPTVDSGRRGRAAAGRRAARRLAAGDQTVGARLGRMCGPCSARWRPTSSAGPSEAVAADHGVPSSRAARPPARPRRPPWRCCR